ncbi:hypothetical protein B484DRAFT_312379, partial [Ochromonadaceae sp. CCMP2298]
HGVTDAGVQKLVQRCPNLTVLSICSCRALTETGLRALVGGLPSLLNLRLSGATHVADFSHLAGFVHLCTLDVGHCPQLTDHDVEMLAAECARLRYVSVCSCPDLTAQSIRALTGL